MRLILAIALALPGFAFAAGGAVDDTKPPKTTKTTQSCKGTQVWDEKTKTCVNPQESSLSDDVLYGAVRELAYAERFDDAQRVLSAMSNQNEDRVLTYWGFTHRKMGDHDLANAFYERAIARNPDNILARPYMAQGFIEAGQLDAAIDQWREIQARGGKGTWAEISLSEAIRTGTTFNY